MDSLTWTTLLMHMVSGGIQGMHQGAAQLHEQNPAIPEIDDAMIFDAALMLAATVIEANPEYADSRRFDQAAEMVRRQVRDNLDSVRAQGEALGTKMLYKHFQAAGINAAFNDRQ